MLGTQGLVVAAASSTTVAIVAIAVSGAVGVVAPIITSVAANKRLRRELAASERRQKEALDAQALHLDRRLGEDTQRLTLRLAADRDCSRTEALRQVLDEGAELVTRFGAVQQETRPSSTPGHFDLPERWAEIVEQVAAYRNRLRLWFPETDDAVQAFDEFLAYTNFHAETKLKPPGPQREAILEGIEEDFHKRREAFLTAARTHLGNPWELEFAVDRR